MRRLVPIVAVSIWIVMSVLVLELSARALFKQITPPGSESRLAVFLGQQGQADATGRFVEEADKFEDAPAVSEIESLPYYLYINKPGSSVNGKVQINRHGHRGPDITDNPADGALRILAIGGSTTYGWLLKDYTDAWPFLLKVKLEKILNRPVEVINAGLPGGTSAESMVAYILRDRHFNPDIVIIHNGGNDGEPLFYENYRPDYAYFRGLSAPQTARPGEALILKSAVMKVLYSHWLANTNTSTIRMRPTLPATPELAIENIKRNEPVGFERNVDVIVKLALQSNSVPIIFPFVMANKSVYGILPKASRYNEAFHDASVAALEKNVAALKRIAARNKVSFVQIPNGTLSDVDFLDHCHLKKSGEQIKADFLAEVISRIQL